MKQQGMNIKEEELEFSDPKEEIAHWKQLAEEYYQKLQETRDELDEFQEGSRELEAELEAQLEQAEQRQRELLTLKSRLENENDNLKQKLEESQNEAYLTITALQDEVAQLKAVKEELQKYVRELEQTNDDLERAKRATMCSLEDFDSRLNQAIERNAILENELDEKETLAVTVQRLKDEARDLRQELAVKSQEKEKEKELKRQEKEKENREKEKDRENKEKEKNEENKENKENKNASKSESKVQIEIGTSPIPIKPDSITSHEKLAMMNSIGTSPLHQPNGLGGSPLTPSARISALNIVGDLLRKVGALESKLASCRNFVKEQPRGLGPGPGLSLVDSSRPRKNNKPAPGQGMQSR